MSATSVVHGAESVQVRSTTVDAWVALDGAQVAPVEFRGALRKASPYALAPWLPQDRRNDPPLLDTMRGDFFCLPFGSQPNGPLHGEPANARWSITAHTRDSVALSLHAHDSGAHIEKTVSVRDGHSALYQEFRIRGLDGEFNYGTHPIIDFSALAPGAGRISTSPLRWSAVFPGVFSDPANGEHQVLAEGAVFDDLSAVPLAEGGTLDLTRYPTAAGHEDLVMLVNDPAAGPIGWSAAVLDGYVWFALKAIADFPSTLLWVSNGGRSQAPWSGRHLGRMGIEDVCSYFADGLESARADKLAALGIRSTRRFTASDEVRLRVAHGVAFTPGPFGRVVDIEMRSEGEVTVCDDAGRTATTAIDWEYVAH